MLWRIAAFTPSGLWSLALAPGSSILLAQVYPPASSWFRIENAWEPLRLWSIIKVVLASTGIQLSASFEFIILFFDIPASGVSQPSRPIDQGEFSIINPRRACAERRVTVILRVCVSTTILALQATT